MIPFYIFYSMFGFQRTGDQLWAAGDARARGFLMGATAGRTTLTGEGLQHDDGHSHVLAMTNPAVRQYDPTFAYELATIIRDGIERMHVKGEDLIYYISIYNENYAQAPKPEGVDEGILRGIYRFAEAPKLAAGTAEGQTPRGPPRRLRLDPAPGHRRPGAPRREAGHRGRGLLGAVVPDAPARRAGGRSLEPPPPDRRSRGCPYVATVLGPKGGPIVAATDWMKALPDLVRPWIDAPFETLGTDGFGRSDTRDSLRAWFEIDPPHIAAAALSALARAGEITPEALAEGLRRAGHRPGEGRPARRLSRPLRSAADRLRPRATSSRDRAVRGS